MILKRLSIKARIVLLCSIPLVALATMQAKTIHDSASVIKQTEANAELLRLMPIVAELIHTLQVERGQSAGHIASGGKAFADTLPQKRADSDEALKQFNNILIGLFQGIVLGQELDMLRTNSRWQLRHMGFGCVANGVIACYWTIREASNFFVEQVN